MKQVKQRVNTKLAAISFLILCCNLFQVKAQPHVVPMTYHRGPILTSFKIYPFYYGNWTTADRNKQQNYLEGLAAYMSGTNAPADQQPVTKQYGILSVSVAPAIQPPPVGSWINPFNDGDATRIILESQRNGILPPFGPNTLIVILLASDINGGCGHHAKIPGILNGFYGYVPTFDCGPLLLVTAHEVFEAAACPWDDGINTGWDEIVDGCISNFNFRPPGTSGTISIPGVADSTNNGSCTSTGYTAINPGNRKYGYVWADKPSDAFYTPNTTFQYNSVGRLNTITRISAGNYLVTFPGIGSAGGTVSVTSYGIENRICKAEEWHRGGSGNQDEIVHIRCFNANGLPADGMFTLSYTEWSTVTDLAYVFADMPASTEYPAGNDKQYIAYSTALPKIQRFNTGVYQVRFPNMGWATPDDPHNGGNVNVTACGVDNTWSKIIRWKKDGSNNDLLIDVACINAAGSATDSKFTVTFHYKTDILGRFDANHAYVWANNPTIASYKPPGKWQYNTQPGDITIVRNSRGDYTVTIPNQNLIGGHVQASACGIGSNRCQVVSWGGQSVRVRCFDATGSPADSEFALSFIAGTERIIINRPNPN